MHRDKVPRASAEKGAILCKSLSEAVVWLEKNMRCYRLKFFFDGRRAVNVEEDILDHAIVVIGKSR